MRPLPYTNKARKRSHVVVLRLKKMSVLRLGEAQPEPLQGEPAALADDEMVQQLDIEQLPSGHDLDGECDVGGRGCRVARGMVVDGDDRGGLLAYRVPEDFTLPSSTCAPA